MTKVRGRNFQFRKLKKKPPWDKKEQEFIIVVLKYFINIFIFFKGGVIDKPMEANKE